MSHIIWISYMDKSNYPDFHGIYISWDIPQQHLGIDGKKRWHSDPAIEDFSPFILTMINY